MKTSGFNNQISAYSEERPPKFHEIALLEIIEKYISKDHFKLLDIGCATGSFLSLISSRYSESEYTGFDISSKLISIAEKRLKNFKANFTVDDALNFKTSTKFDFIVASGVLSIFEDLNPLNIWTDWLAENGTLFIFGRFNSKEIDTIIRFRNHYNKNVEDSNWQGGLTSFSIKYTADYLNKLGFESEFIPFHFPETLEKSSDPIRTYTVDTINQEKLILNGANILAEQYFLIVRK
tara:strand:- start:289 stop:996 length:708 start_codon:yes stop_codon:yes gene_type:complete